MDKRKGLRETSGGLKKREKRDEENTLGMKIIEDKEFCIKINWLRLSV